MDSAYDYLERMLENSDATPMFLPLGFLKSITRDFSSDFVLGEGGFGVVYKGVLRSGKVIAVKKLSEMRVTEKEFQKEVSYLMEIKHENVVKFVGYCAKSKWEAMEQPSGSGKHIMAEIPKRFLCFEYVRNKSLDKHISDASWGLDWNMRYKIINGICIGLHFLHDECGLIHLDLKPENILMDSNMTPKIADFGLSRLFGKDQSRDIAESCVGTRGYIAPEYQFQHVISKKADIFSLGVIVIEIITGDRRYPYFQQDSPETTATSLLQFTEKVLGSWRKNFVCTPKYKEMEIYAQQVSQCITIALKCVDPSMEKRPTAKEIIQMLHALDQEAPKTDAINQRFLKVSSSMMCDTVKDSIRKFYAGDISNVPMEMLYRSAYTLALHRDIRSLHSVVKNVMASEVEGLGRALDNIQDDTMFLHELLARWHLHCTSVSHVHKLMSYVYRSVFPLRNKVDVYDYGVRLWRDNMVLSEIVWPRLMEALRRREKEGGGVATAATDDMIAGLTHMLMLPW